MSNFSEKGISLIVAKRVLAFLNTVRDAKALLEQAPKSSQQPTGNWIGETVAARIISIRNAIPGRRLKSLSQLNTIKGFGQDKFDELTAMFEVNPSEAFRLAMYDGVLLNNWEFKHSTKALDATKFAATAPVDCLLKNYIAEEIKILCKERFNNQQAAEIASRTLDTTYIERFEDAHLASYAFAFWLYKLDMDNWFSFEKVRLKSELYFSTNPNHNDRLELVMFKGFNNTNVLNQPLNTKDLPVVINHAENSISIWSAQLND